MLIYRHKGGVVYDGNVERVLELKSKTKSNKFVSTCAGYVVEKLNAERRLAEYKDSMIKGVK